MSLPPGFLDELRDRSSLSQVVGRKVTWDQRKSNQGKGDMWAPCPFHQEKSASFHVDDRKGFYYCFGCHAKGDAISFVRETENVGFMEAIEILAREAGMQVPARDPVAQRKADRRSQLAEVMEAAVRHFRMQLGSAAGADARAYLARRGLAGPALERFGLGFAPDARQGLWAHLRGAGVAEDLIVDAGLAARPDDGGQPYDRFRDRIIFPIRDARGRAIALGGRAMSPNARAKYLNSPETELFDKGRSLYNLSPAREAAGKGQPLIVAEGYMDVIALVEAGFAGAVAPLGTAITESQLRMLWRISPEPVVALDGDRAGLAAAMRLMDLALPLIEAGQSLRFVLLPEGKDPDDLLRAEGPEAMRKLLEEAQPMVRLLWRRETENQVFDSPERKAALDKRLREAVRKIADPSIRRHYGEDIQLLRRELFGYRREAPVSRDGGGFVPREGAGGTRGYAANAGGGRFGAGGGFAGKGRARAPLAGPPLPSTRNSFLVGGADHGGGAADPEEELRQSVILAVLITHPSVLPRFEGQLEMLDVVPGLRPLRDALLRHGMDGDVAGLSEKIAGDVGAALENLFSLSHVRIVPAVRKPSDTELAIQCVTEELAKLAARRGALKEISEAAEDLAGQADEGLTWRLGQAAEARNSADRSRTDDSPDIGEDREELSNFLQNLIDGEVWVKKKG
ncbi:DNA primase [Brevirhabdus sp.]|uniref:DNA primase n=1 Tax=Brevirhabdus sp. TaxID=2004514 RepID=UPI0040583F92